MIKRNSSRRSYRAGTTDKAAWDRARRPRTSSLVENCALVSIVAKKLTGLWMIRLEYAVIPTFFFLLASYLVWNYPVTNERHAKLVASLARREAREQQGSGGS